MTGPGRTPTAVLVVLVALGGAAGTGGRYAVERLVPTPGDWPWPTLLVNVLGSFVLGLLLAGLARGRAGAAAERLLADGRAAAALAYVAASLLLGLAAASAGLALLGPRRVS